MDITITDIVGEGGRMEETISLTYLIQSKEVTVVSIFSDNVQYWLQEPKKYC